MEEHSADVSVFLIWTENAAVVRVVSPALQNLKVTVFLRKTAVPMLQSLKEIQEVVKSVPLYEQLFMDNLRADSFSEEEFQLLGHSCRECCLWVTDWRWFCPLATKVTSPSSLSPLKTKQTAKEALRPERPSRRVGLQRQVSPTPRGRKTEGAASISERRSERQDRPSGRYPMRDEETLWPHLILNKRSSGTTRDFGAKAQYSRVRKIM